MSHEHDDVDNNSSSNQTFQTVIGKRLTRRELFGGAASTAALVAVGASASNTAAAQGAVAYGGGNGGGHGPGYGGARHQHLRLNFDPVAKNLEDAVTLPAGYSCDVFRAGDHHDGMYFFGLGGNGRYSPYVSARGLLVLNHEAVTPAFLHPTGQTIVGGARTVAEEVQREF